MADTLAPHGSGRAARHLLAAAHSLEMATERESNADSDSLLWPLAALVESSDAGTVYGGGWDSREVQHDREAEPISGEVQEDIRASGLEDRAGRWPARGGGGLTPPGAARPAGEPAERAGRRATRAR